MSHAFKKRNVIINHFMFLTARIFAIDVVLRASLESKEPPHESDATAARNNAIATLNPDEIVVPSDEENDADGGKLIYDSN